MGRWITVDDHPVYIDNPRVPDPRGSKGGGGTPPEKKPPVDENLHANPHINRALNIGKRAGVNIEVAGPGSDHFKGKRLGRAMAAYYSDTDTIRINEKSTYWSNQEELVEMHKTGWQSSAHPDHVIFHELAHREHYKIVESGVMARSNPAMRTKSDVRDAWHKLHGKNGRMTEIIAKEVSEYGSTSKTEFVAEARAGMRAGKTYSPKIMDYYKSLGGPV